jgi:hypothetical protein
VNEKALAHWGAIAPIKGKTRWFLFIISTRFIKMLALILISLFYNFY